ncbi:hypothetical protein K438DRAFT_1774469 [Mycena galopus ATCC 62051]|nr:hypothetical protein K438DRAFT_1774469 [Mycena galopus ATCC 62051]
MGVCVLFQFSFPHFFELWQFPLRTSTPSFPPRTPAPSQRRSLLTADDLSRLTTLFQIDFGPFRPDESTRTSSILERGYAPRRPKVCRIHYRVLFGPGCDCNQYYHGKRTSDEERRCAAGCLTSAGQRAIKYGADCSCIDARRKPGYSPSTCHCGGSSCSNCNALPVLDPRTRHAESRRYARAMDRKLPPPVPSLHSMPLDEYVQLPFELRASMKKAEERTRNRTYSVSFAVGRAKLWEYLDPKYITDATQVFRPAYRDGPLAQAFDLWCCPVSLSQSNPFKPPSICGMIIDLRQISNDLVWHSRHSEPSLVLMETKLSRAFNEAICSHLRQHMNSFGLDFDSHIWLQLILSHRVLDYQ